MTVTNGRGYVKSEVNKKLYDIKKEKSFAIEVLLTEKEKKQ